jgi:outer membrane usher protein
MSRVRVSNERPALFSGNLVRALPLLIASAMALDAQPPGDNTDPRLTVLSVRINGIAQAGTDRGIIMLEQSGRLLARPQDLSALSLRIPDTMAVPYDGTAYVALDAVQGLKYKVAQETQELDITAEAAAFASKETPDPGAAADGERSGGGAFLNYDLVTEYSHQFGASALLETGVFGHWGVLTSSLAWRGIGGSEWSRLSTSFVHDFAARRESLRLGDSATRAGAWGRPVYFGGIQWGTDFSTQPDLVTFPLPSIKGEAIAPSTAELYVNNSLRQTSQVAPGPFEIRQPPLVSGPGQVSLVVRDILGRETVTTSNYFASPRLLRPGLADYSVDAGVIRRSFGQVGANYGGLFASGIYKSGLTNRITTEVRGELAGGLRDAGMTVTINPAGALLTTAGVAASNQRESGGNLAMAAVEWQTRAFSIGVQGQRATPGFRQLGLDRDLLPSRRRLSAFLGVSPTGRDHFTASYFRQDDLTRIAITTASYSRNLGRRLFGSLTMTRATAGHTESVFTSALTWQIDERTTLSPTYTRRGGSDVEQLQLQRNLPVGPGEGFRATAGNERQEASATLRTQMATYQLEGARTGGASAVRAGVQGAVAWVRGKVLATRSIDDAFAIVKVGHFAGVHVLADNQPVAVTDSHGVAIVPHLRSFQPNRISVDARDLPIDASVDALEIVVRPTRRVGIRVEFPIAESNGLLVRLTDESGAPVPMGAMVTPDGSHTQFPVALRGAVYLTGLEPGAILLRVAWEQASCVARFRVTADDLKSESETNAVCVKERTPGQ